MNDFIRMIKQFLLFFKCWQVIEPWEQALCVRLGKKIRLWEGGLHFKIPYADEVYIQSTRMRMCPLGRQTLSTLDGKVITLSGTLGYTIADIGKLYTTLHHAEETISNMAMVAIAQYVATHELAVCEPKDIVAQLHKTLNLERFGLGDVETYLTDFAVVRTFRLVGDVQYSKPYNGPSSLNTERTNSDLPLY